MKNEVVGLARAAYDSKLYESLCEVVERAGCMDSSRSVTVKINLCDARTPETGAITSPVMLSAFLKYLRHHEKVQEIFVVESDATVVFADLFVKWFGIDSVLKKWDAKWVNLSKAPVMANTETKRITHLRRTAIPCVLKDTYLVSFAKMKTNLLTSISCALKNQFGCIPLVAKSIYHNVIDDVIAEANIMFQPDFSIVDGIVSMGGVQGPALGIPIPSNVIAAGKDPVSVDATCARIMGFNPNSIGHLRRATSKGVGTMRCAINGPPINEFKYDFQFNRIVAEVLRFGGRLQRRAWSHLRNDWRKYERT